MMVHKLLRCEVIKVLFKGTGILIETILFENCSFQRNKDWLSVF